MLRVIAIDDEPLALEVIKSMAGQAPLISVVACFMRASAAMSYLQQELIDLLFLDVRMPDMTGIDFIRALPRPPMVIFTTAYSDHAVQSFELDAVDYLLKPFSLARFLKACNKATELAALKKLQPGMLPSMTSIFVKSGYEQIRVTLDKIRYVESSGNYVQLVLEDRRIVSRLTMSEVASLLPANAFIRIHRSYFAAKSKITKIDKQTVWLDAIELPVGEAFYPEIQKLVMNK